MYPNDLWIVSPTENYLYKVNEGTQEITKVSITSSQPRALYVSKDKVSVYVCNRSSNTVSVFKNGIFTNEIKVGKLPWAVCESIDGNIYVANYGDNTVSRINKSNYKVTSTIVVDNGPRGLVTDESGDIYVTCYLSNTVCKIVNNKMVDSIEVGLNPEGITCDYNDNIWVACYGSNIVSKIYRNQKILDVEVGYGPISVVCNKDGIVYVANYLGNTITVIEKQQGINDDTNISYTDIITTNITVEDGPNSLSVDYNDNIYVTNSISNTISIINGKTLLKTFDSICNNPTAYGDGTGGIIYNIRRVRTPCEGGGDDSPITYDDLDQYLKDILDKVINNQVESSSENVSYDNSEYTSSTNVKLALNELYEKAKNLSGINSDLLDQIQNLQDSDSSLQEKIEQILQQIESLTTKDTELEGRVRVLETQSGTIDPEISEKITKLEGYFSEDGKANSSLDSDKLGGKDPSYYVNDDELEELKTKDTELENRISSLEEFGTEVDPEISEKITKLEGYFSEDGKANSSLNSDKLGGKDPSYYASTEQLNSVINGITWKNPVLNITKLKEINSPQEGWTVSIEDTNKIYRFDTSTEIESDSDDETKIKANDGTTGSWLLLGTVVYNKATQEQDGLMSKEDKTTVDNLGSTYLSLAGGEVTGEITANKIYANNNILVFNNVEEMKASNKIKQGYTVQTLGFYEAGDGGGATYYSLPEDDDSEVDGYSIIEVQEVIGGAKVGIDKVGSSEVASYKQIKLKLQIYDFLNIKWFGAKIDGVTDDSDSFNRAVTFITGGKTDNIEGYTLYVPKGIMKINKTIKIDMGCMKLKCDGTVIDASSVDGDAFVIDSNVINNPVIYNNRTNYIEGFRIYGTREEGNNGVVYSKSSAQVHNLTIRNIVIHDFDKGMVYGNHTYSDTVFGCSIYNCNICVDNSPNNDAGERISFINTSLFNSDLAINNHNPNGSMNFLQCSIDYVNQAVNNATNCSTFFTDCHLEWNSHSKPFIVIGGDGSIVSIKGGYIVYQSSTGYDDYIIENNAKYSGGLYIDGTYIAGLRGTYLINRKPLKLSNISNGNMSWFPFVHYKEYASYKNLKYVPENILYSSNSTLEIEEDYIKWSRNSQGGNLELIQKVEKDNSIWDFVLQISADSTLNDGCWVQIGFGIKDINGEFKSIFLQGDQNLKDRFNENLNTIINMNTTLHKNDIINNIQTVDNLYVYSNIAIPIVNSSVIFKIKRWEFFGR